MSAMPREWKPRSATRSAAALSSCSRVRRPRAVLATGAAITYPSVRLRQPERLLRDEVQDHLAADRRDAQQAYESPQVGEPVLRRHAVAAMGLDRGVERGESRVGRRELGHVRRLPGHGAAAVGTL